MIRQTRFVLPSAMVLFLAAAASTPLFAAPAGKVSSNNETVKTRSIRFDVRNDGKAAMTVQDGDVQLTVKPGATAHVKLPLGSHLVAVSGTDEQAGATLATVDPMLEGNTLAIH